MMRAYKKVVFNTSTGAEDTNCSHIPTFSCMFLHFRVFGDFKPYPRHTMEKLVPETLSHLTSSHLEYFVKWSKLLLIEASMEAKWKTIRDVWTKPVKDRY